MDSLHLFTIPKWIPENILPSELWTIIFCWKWRLEMRSFHKKIILKSIHKELSLKIPTDEPRYLGATFGVKMNGLYDEAILPLEGEYSYISGDYLSTWLGHPRFNEVIIIKPKCGIELLNRNSSVLKGTHKNLYKYLTENLGLVCSKTLDWNKMVKLLRTV